jgi:hypothetical protein
MRRFHFYQADTGVLHQNCVSINAPNAEKAAAGNCPPGHEIIEGNFDYLSQRVDVAAVAADHATQLSPHASRVAEMRAALVPSMPGGIFREPAPAPIIATAAHIVDYQPPAPSAEHEWNATTKRWQLNAAATAKAQARTAALATIATLDMQSIRATRELALGVPGALERVAAIDAQIATLRGQL